MPLPSVTNINLASLTASGGATLSLPSVVTFTNSSGVRPNWEVRDLGSRIVLENLRSMTLERVEGYYMSVTALAGGSIEFPALTDIFDGYLNEIPMARHNASSTARSTSAGP